MRFWVSMNLAAPIFVVLGTVATSPAPESRTVEKPLARELAGSYQLRRGHVLDIGPLDEAGGSLFFLDQKTLRVGFLRPSGDKELVAGPTLGSDLPPTFRAEVVRGRNGAVKGLIWSGEGFERRVARKIAPRRDEDVEIHNGEVTLRGLLSVPAGPGPHPAIVFAHGSGDATRNVGPFNVSFVRLGFAVLSLDKRGAGESTGDWTRATLDDIAGDWLAGVEFLRERKDIDATRIGVLGSSQGGWTAPIMAARSKSVAFVIVRAGSGVSVSETMVHEIGWSVREAGFGEADATAAREAARRAFAAAGRGASWDEFRGIVDPYLSEKWAEHVWAIRMSESGWGRHWVRLNANYDATEALRSVHVPVLWFLADKDHNLPTDASAPRIQAALRASGNRDYQIVMIRDAGHGFTSTKTGNNSEFARQTHMAPGYWSTVASWLGKRFPIR